MVYGVLLLIKMKKSSTSSRSRSSSRSSSRATSPVRTSVSNSVLGPVPSHAEDRERLSMGAAPTSLVCEGNEGGGALGLTSQPHKTKDDRKKKSSCSNTSQTASRRTKKPMHRSRSPSDSSSKTGSPTGAAHRGSTSPAAPASGATLAAMTRDQRIRRWLQGLKQESLEASIPEEDIPGREDSLDEEDSQCDSQNRENIYPTGQSNGHESTPHTKEDKVK